MNTRCAIWSLLRSFVNRRRPIFAHLCVTERCNLRCRYCQVWQAPHPELSTDAMKSVIEAIKRLGVFYLSFTGGEPLLREDICKLIDHASSLGMHTSVTSNGTLALARYSQLLGSRVDRISISLDGLQGSDLPYSKCDPKILRTIEYVNVNRGQKLVSLCTVLHEDNQADVDAVIRYSEAEGIPLLIQPVVTGSGKLRREGTKVRYPATRSGYIVTPRFFHRAADAYFENDGLNWDCLGGQLFFDIKPNGEFWICQDYPTGLNLLDPRFEVKWATYDFDAARGACESGCIYSCYYLTQMAWKPRNIPDDIETYLRLQMLSRRRVSPSGAPGTYEPVKARDKGQVVS